MIALRTFFLRGSNKSSRTRLSISFSLALQRGLFDVDLGCGRLLLPEVATRFAGMQQNGRSLACLQRVKTQRDLRFSKTKEKLLLSSWLRRQVTSFGFAFFTARTSWRRFLALLPRS